MCRRCGAPDRRPSAKRRKVMTRRLAEIHGNGVICPCVWCGVLVAAVPGRLVVPGRDGRPGTYLPVLKLERDRLEPGGPYSMWNLVPSCPPCNKARTYAREDVPEGCEYGGGRPGPDLAPCPSPRTTEAVVDRAAPQSDRVTLTVNQRTENARHDPIGQVWAAIATHVPDRPINAWPHFYGVPCTDQPISYTLANA